MGTGRNPRGQDSRVHILFSYNALRCRMSELAAAVLPHLFARGRALIGWSLGAFESLVGEGAVGYVQGVEKLIL
jgi:hypothetical protein